MKHRNVVMAAMALVFFCGCDDSGCSSDSAKVRIESADDEKHGSVGSRSPQSSEAGDRDDDAVRPDTPDKRGEKAPRSADAGGKKRGGKAGGDGKSGGASGKKNGRIAGGGGKTGGASGKRSGRNAGGGDAGENDAGERGENNGPRDGRRGSGRRGAHEPPAGWLEPDAKNPPAPDKRQLWSLLEEEIRRLTVARSVEFAPLGATGTSLEPAGKKMAFSGRCEIIDDNGDRRAYSFAGEMLGDKYRVVVLNIKFSEPSD